MNRKHPLMLLFRSLWLTQLPSLCMRERSPSIMGILHPQDWEWRLSYEDLLE